MTKEAAARIKINKWLELTGYRIIADASGPATKQLEPKVTLTVQALDTPGEIVVKVEAEQAHVAANRELVIRLDHKIQATLARNWGEESSSAASAS